MEIIMKNRLLANNIYRNIVTLHLCNCKVQPHCALLGYPFHNMAAHTEAMPTREGILTNAYLALTRGDL